MTTHKNPSSLEKRKRGFFALKTIIEKEEVFAPKNDY